MIDLFAAVAAIVIGFYYGGRVERRHYASIREREAEHLQIATYSGKRVRSEDCEIELVWLVTGGVVLTIDRFKLIGAAIRQALGGSVRSYATLIDRARREAILRMKEDGLSADGIYNVRVETAQLGGAWPGVVTVEAIAYGTAVRYRK